MPLSQKCGAHSTSGVKKSQHSGRQTGEVHNHNSSQSEDESLDLSDDNVPVVLRSGQSSTSQGRELKLTAWIERGTNGFLQKVEVRELPPEFHNGMMHNCVPGDSRS